MPRRSTKPCTSRSRNLSVSILVLRVGISFRNSLYRYGRSFNLANMTGFHFPAKSSSESSTGQPKRLASRFTLFSLDPISRRAPAPGDNNIAESYKSHVAYIEIRVFYICNQSHREFATWSARRSIPACRSGSRGVRREVLSPECPVRRLPNFVHVPYCNTLTLLCDRCCFLAGYAGDTKTHHRDTVACDEAANARFFLVRVGKTGSTLAEHFGQIAVSLD